MEELFCIEVTHTNGTFQPHWLVLHMAGTRGVTPMKNLATMLRLPEAWLALQEVRATPANEFEYRIVRA